MTTAPGVSTRQALPGALVAAGLLISSAVAAGELSYGSISPPTHALITEGFQPYADKVKQETGGKVSFQLFSGGSVVSAKTVLSSIGDGLVSSGYVVDAYIPQVLPNSNLSSDLGVYNNNALSATAAATEYQLLNCPGCLKDMDKAGAVTLGVHSLAPYVLMCKTEVKNLADLKGKKVKTAGLWGRLTAEFGMTPVNLPVTDIYEALERGTLDCVLGPEGWLKSYNIWDSVRFVIEEPLGTWAGGHGMAVNKAAWTALTPDQRAVMLANAPALLTGMTLAYDHEAAIARAEAKKRDITYVPTLPGLDAAFQQAREGVRAEAVKKAASRGVQDPETAAKTYRALLGKWEKIVADAKGDRTKIEAAMKAEIYDKLPN
ncbi:MULTISPECIES: C4-dicarboxylate TRAP transporter substrate-binding protein [unclassified Xanthobacter]|uniref:C4-dicarboxylate TRAP transporter substrate-binding protein n=1 Tax=unclassified Xanthobacter TaxID=2623496 RepID=UPI001EDEE79F|nr:MULTISPECIES: C4-dicarboxylate TRAP transporter substrate-binding protein [unclassified Xanthobacter]